MTGTGTDDCNETVLAPAGKHRKYRKQWTAIGLMAQLHHLQGSRLRGRKLFWDQFQCHLRHHFLLWNLPNWRIRMSCQVSCGYFLFPPMPSCTSSSRISEDTELSGVTLIRVHMERLDILGGGTPTPPSGQREHTQPVRLTYYTVYTDP